MHHKPPSYQLRRLDTSRRGACQEAPAGWLPLLQPGAEDWSRVEPGL